MIRRVSVCLWWSTHESLRTRKPYVPDWYFNTKFYLRSVLLAGKVPDEERLFVSSNCSLLVVFFDDAFVPSFVNFSAITPEIRALCGENKECIYDALTTGNRELAQQTAGFEEENQNLVNDLGKQRKGLCYDIGPSLGNGIFCLIIFISNREKKEIL